MDYLQWISTRIAQLRSEKGVSARDMSLSLGQSESYINKIENQRTMPSMSGFFYICEYLGISPKEFFDTDIVSPANSNEILRMLGKLPSSKAEHVLQIIQDMTE